MVKSPAEVICSPQILHRLRVDQGLSISDLAKAAELSRACLSRIESGERNARASTARRLAGALGVHVRELHPESGTV